MRANNAFIKKYEGSFLKQQIGHRSSNYYGLYKIQKSKIISKSIQKQNSENTSCFQPKGLKIRSTVVGHKYPTKRLSNWLLQPIQHW